jgi:hypothetical protein
MRFMRLYPTRDADGRDPERVIGLHGGILLDEAIHTGQAYSCEDRS